jgi:tetratricopeptide (TPR) repeat protein
MCSKIYMSEEGQLTTVSSYTHGIACSDPDADADMRDLMRDLYRSRSLADLQLGRYGATILDAHISTSNSQDDIAKSEDAKAWFLRGRANYQLGHYSDALKTFQHMLILSPSDFQGHQELEKTKKRVLEQQEGIYDFAEMIDEVTQWTLRYQGDLHGRFDSL